MTETIHICYILSDKEGRLAKYAATSLLSALQNTASPVTVHLILDGTPGGDEQRMFTEMVSASNRRICFYDVTKLQDKLQRQLNLPQGQPIPPEWYRLLLAEILPLPKVLYFDLMLLIHADISLLWELDLEDYVAAAVPFHLLTGDRRPNRYVLEQGLVEWQHYFQTGMLYLDLDKIRSQEPLIEQAKRLWQEHPSCQGEIQDTWNVLLGKSCMPLPPDCNTPVMLARQQGAPVGGMYLYQGKALGMDLQEPFNNLYYSYYKDTPWYEKRPDYPQPFLDIALDADTYGRLAMQEHPAYGLVDLYEQVSQGDFYQAGPTLCAVLQRQLNFLCRTLLQLEATGQKKLFSEYLGYLPPGLKRFWQMYVAQKEPLTEDDKYAISLVLPLFADCGTREQLRRFVKLLPNLPVAILRSVLTSLFERQLWKPVAEICGYLEAQDQGNDFSAYVHGLACYQLGDKEGAVTYLKQAAALGNQQPDLQLHLQLAQGLGWDELS